MYISQTVFNDITITLISIGILAISTLIAIANRKISLRKKIDLIK